MLSGCDHPVRCLVVRDVGLQVLASPRRRSRRGEEFHQLANIAHIPVADERSSAFEDFVQGVTALRILAAGEMLALIFGPTSITLITTGHSREHCIAVGLAAAVMALGGLLIPLYGLEGAAVAVAVSTLTQALGQAVFIRRRLGFFPCIVRVG